MSGNAIPAVAVVSVIPADITALGDVTLTVAANDLVVGGEQDVRNYTVTATPAGVTYVTANSCQGISGPCTITTVAGADQSVLSLDVRVTVSLIYACWLCTGIL